MKVGQKRTKQHTYILCFISLACDSLFNDERNDLKGMVIGSQPTEQELWIF